MGFHKWRYPNSRIVYNGKSFLYMDDLEVPYFRKPPTYIYIYFRKPQICIYIYIHIIYNMYMNIHI